MTLDPTTWPFLFQVIAGITGLGAAGAGWFGVRQYRNGNGNGNMHKSNGSNGKLDIKILYAEHVTYQGEMANNMAQFTAHSKVISEGITYLVKREKLAERNQELKKIRKQIRKELQEEMENK